VLIAETIWLLERGQTDRQTDEVADATERHISGTDGNRGVGITCSPDVDHNTHWRWIWALITGIICAYGYSNEGVRSYGAKLKVFRFTAPFRKKNKDAFRQCWRGYGLGVNRPPCVIEAGVKAISLIPFPNKN